MPLMPVDATTKSLKWSDFQTEDTDEPAPGKSVHAAYTKVTFAMSQLDIKWVDGSKPAKYRWTTEPTVTVAFDSAESWVASFVDKRPADQKAALLNHEQGHYMLTALFARDYFNELKAMAAKDYSAPATGSAELAKINAKYATSVAQGLHKTYDQKVPNPVANAVEQAKWDKAIEAAKTGNKTIKDALKAAGLISI